MHAQGVGRHQPDPGQKGKKQLSLGYNKSSPIISVARLEQRRAGQVLRIGPQGAPVAHADVPGVVGEGQLRSEQEEEAEEDDAAAAAKGHGARDGVVVDNREQAEPAASPNGWADAARGRNVDQERCKQ